MLNIFSPSRLIPHIPCAFDCKPSIAFAKKLARIWSKQHDFTARMFNVFSLRIPVLAWSFQDYCLLLGKTEGKKAFFSDVSAHYSENFEKAAELVRVFNEANSLELRKNKIVFSTATGKKSAIGRKNPFDGALLAFDSGIF